MSWEMSGHVVFCTFYFDQFYSHFTNNYLLLCGQLLNDFTTFMTYDSFPTSRTRTDLFYWDATDG